MYPRTVLLVLISNLFPNTHANILFFDSPVSNYNEAEQFCQSTLGTHLATITSISDSNIDALETLLQRYGLLRGWIGLSSSNGIYSWLDSTPCTESTNPLCSNLWSIGQPQASSSTNACVSVGFDRRSNTFTLNTMPCEQGIFLFCNAPVPTQSPSVLPTVSPTKTCCQCLTPHPSIAGCQLDSECEQQICHTDQVCCDSDDGGWDDLCAHDAYRVCTQPDHISSDIEPDSVVSSPTLPPTQCDRHRMPWHQLTQSQRELYINGLRTLSAMGRLRVFTETHANVIAAGQAHETSAFLPWHRYFLWELESQFRALGGEYECFGLPYWDWSYEVEQFGLNYQDYHILHSGLGGDGTANDNNCLNDGSLFSKGNYVPFDCTRTGRNGQCCLQRSVCDNNGNGCTMSSAAHMISNIAQWDFYGTDFGGNTILNPGYRESLETEVHTPAHNVIGGGGHLGDPFTSPDDPIFYLLHSFVDYNWALWQDCHDFDTVAKQVIHDDVYVGVTNGRRTVGPSDIDDVLIYTELAQYDWSYIATHPNPTSRDMHSLSDWDVSYERGTFWQLARVDDVCSNINPTWFYDTVTTDRRRLSEIENGFAYDVFVRLNNSLSIRDEMDKKRLLKKWNKLNCEYLHIGGDCERPKFFDDCSKMKRNEYGDIEVTLQELIDKVRDYPCMISVRERYYEWTRKTHTLYKLCRGDFDTFCDKAFLHETGADQCTLREARIRESANHKEQSLLFEDYDEDEHAVREYNQYYSYFTASNQQDDDWGDFVHGSGSDSHEFYSS